MAEENAGTSLADVIDNALSDLENGTHTPIPGPDDEAVVADTPVTGEDADASDADPTADDAVAKADAEGADATSDGRVRDPATGKFVAKKPAESVGDKPVKPKEGEAAVKVGADGKPIVEAKKPDPLNDELPKDVKAETRQRFEQLRELTKTTITERDTIKQELDYIVQGVQATGANAEQYAETLSWLAMFNSGDTKQQEKALELVELVADRLATSLGKQRTLNDPLKEHADLQAAVQTGKINREYAQQLAVARNRDKFTTEVRTSAQTAEQQAADNTRQHEAAKVDLNNIEKELRAKDPQFDAKSAIIVPILKGTFTRTPYKDWGAAFRDAYSKCVLPAAVVPAVVPKTPKNQPLRANKSGGGAGGASASKDDGPKSMLEAINAALG